MESAFTQRPDPSGLSPSRHAEWLETEADRLVDWALLSRAPQGFGYLSETGTITESVGRQLLITCRMVIVFSVATLRAEATAASSERTTALRDAAAHGIRLLQGPFHDDANGGWISQLPWGDDHAAEGQRKLAYEHAFVLAAASTAVLAGIAGAGELFRAAGDTVLDRFWDAAAGALRESFAADWSAEEDYRGANSNMHFVEACLVAADAAELLHSDNVVSITGDGSSALESPNPARSTRAAWLERATRVSDRLINHSARQNGWRLLEHYGADWQPLREYNRDDPDHQYRPYGYMVGHSMEWVRLLTQLDLATDHGVTWLPECAAGLWETAIRVGLATDGNAGFGYTLDWDDRPVSRNRLHWVAAEAVGGAWARYQLTGDERYLASHDELWDYIRDAFVDDERGSWHHELTAAGAPAATVWEGKPDVYHAYQSVVLPLVPFGVSLPAVLRRHDLVV